MKKKSANINNLSTECRFSVGDMVAFTQYASPYAKDFEEVENHGIVVESAHSIIKVRPLQDFSNIVLCNAADCRLITSEDK